MRGPEEWSSRRSNPADRIRLTGPAATNFSFHYPCKAQNFRLPLYEVLSMEAIRIGLLLDWRRAGWLGSVNSSSSIGAPFSTINATRTPMGCWEESEFRGHKARRRDQTLQTRRAELAGRDRGPPHLLRNASTPPQIRFSHG